eukprot:8951391-Pyramimonas_sp.AAC.1
MSKVHGLMSKAQDPTSKSRDPISKAHYSKIQDRRFNVPDPRSKVKCSSSKNHPLISHIQHTLLTIRASMPKIQGPRSRIHSSWPKA